MLRRLDFIVAVLITAALTAAALLLGRPERLDGAGARAIDGDTLAIGARRLRLEGLDAPELAQTCGEAARPTRCGEAAREALRSLISGGTLSCEVRGRDKYGRDLATCRVRDEDVGAALVRRGAAVASGRYRAEERLARTEKAGLWAGPFDLPSEWRRVHRP